MQFSEAQATLCNTKLNTSLTDIAAGSNQLFSIQDIKDAINFGVKKAWNYKPWTFTEGLVSVTAPGTTTASYDYPVNFEDESVDLIVVNGVPWFGEGKGKRNFVDYLKFLADWPSDNSLIWTEKGRKYYLNQNAYSGGQNIDLYGKLRAPVLSADADLLPFSPTSDNYEDSGNEAIVVLAYGSLLDSEKKKDRAGAMAEEKKAFAMLDEVWKPIGERRAQKNPQNHPFFNVDDHYSGRPTRSNTNIANFP